MSDPLLISVAAASHLLDISPRAAYYEVERSGGLLGVPVIQVLGKNRISVEALRAAIAKQSAA